MNLKLIIKQIKRRRHLEKRIKFMRIKYELRSSQHINQKDPNIKIMNLLLAAEYEYKRTKSKLEIMADPIDRLMGWCVVAGLIGLGCFVAISFSRFLN